MNTPTGETDKTSADDIEHLSHADETLDPNVILEAEFQYIAQSLFQTNEDRSRVTSFYLVTLGSFIAALLGSTQLSNLQLQPVYAAFAALFGVVAIMGLLTLLQLLKLRLAWFEAAAAMNEIKRYYIEHRKDLNLGSAFRWNPGGLGSRFRLWSVGFMLALQVAVLGGASLAAAIIFAGLAANPSLWLWWPAAVGIVLWTAVQMVIYWQVLLRSEAK
ncbi:MAG: hypothetical protein NT169_12760 [Chloroflexi bacterium]|nr:hypothetical protein [Chloroflexota bacterium]